MLTENGFVGNPLRKPSDQQSTSKPGSDAIVDDKDKDTVEICRRSIQKRHLITVGLIGDRRHHHCGAVCNPDTEER